MFDSDKLLVILLAACFTCDEKYCSALPSSFRLTTQGVIIEVSKHHSHCAASFPAPFSLNLALHWSFKKEGLLGFLYLICFFLSFKVPSLFHSFLFIFFFLFLSYSVWFLFLFTFSSILLTYSSHILSMADIHSFLTITEIGPSQLYSIRNHL